MTVQLASPLFNHGFTGKPLVHEVRPWLGHPSRTACGIWLGLSWTLRDGQAQELTCQRCRSTYRHGVPA